MINIKDDVKLHLLNTDKYKTSVVSIFLTKKLNRENITKEALIPAVLRMGTNSITTKQELGKKLENMYGANFNCGIEKRGNNHVMKFYIESINDKYTIQQENILQDSIKLLFEIVLNPLIKNDSFYKEYVDCEKENLKRIILSKIDNKGTYAYLRCLEEMFDGQDYSLYEYGYIEDLENINEKNLYEYYKTFISECKIDIFISGQIENETEIVELVKNVSNNKKYLNINDRKAIYIEDSQEKATSKKNVKQKEEKMDVTQGKLVIGLNLNNNGDNIAASSVYNAILGGGANSKLFQNVREKASLAYTAGSGYLKTKNIIVIRCGIEIKNYEKAVNIITEQLEDMKKGEFSETDIQNAKELIIGSISSIKDEQTSEISYLLSQELTNNPITIDGFISQIKNISKQDIVEIANQISENTIYFLRN